jgi:hypothetical protein
MVWLFQIVPSNRELPKLVLYTVVTVIDIHDGKLLQYCTVLYCTVLYCTVLYCTVLYCTVLYCTVLYCTVLYSTELYQKTEKDCYRIKNLLLFFLNQMHLFTQSRT